MSQIYSPKVIKYCPFCGSRLEAVQNRLTIGDVLADRGFVKCQACGYVFQCSRPGLEPSSNRRNRND